MSRLRTIRNIALAVGASVTAAAAYNCAINHKANNAKSFNSPMLSAAFHWKLGDIHYTKQGSGSPILLIHDYLSPAASWEWKHLSRGLSTKHTVYTVDLPGCGLSDKSFTSYTTYLYVQLLDAFIREVIREPVFFVSSGHSIQIGVLLYKQAPASITKLLALNPPGKKTRHFYDIITGNVITLPFIGTFIFNRMTSVNRLEKYFDNAHLFHDKDLETAYTKAFWKGAHMNRSGFRYLFASHLRGYLDTTSAVSLQHVTIPATILVGIDVKDSDKSIAYYQKQKPDITIRQIPNGRLMMQAEQATDIAQMIHTFS